MRNLGVEWSRGALLTEPDAAAKHSSAQCVSRYDGTVLYCTVGSRLVAHQRAGAMAETRERFGGGGSAKGGRGESTPN